MSSAQKAKRSYTLAQKEQILREHVEHGLSCKNFDLIGDAPVKVGKR